MIAAFAAALRESKLSPLKRLESAFVAAGCRPSDWLSMRVSEPDHRTPPDWGWHHLSTARANVFLGLVVILPLVGVSFLGGAYIDHHWPQPDDRTSILLSFAGLMGTITTLINGLIIFVAKAYGDRLGKVGFLSPLHFDRAGFVARFTIAMGIVAANVVVALAGWATNIKNAQAVLAVLDVLLYPATIAMMLPLMVRTISSVDIDLFYKQLLSALSNDYSHYLDREVQQIRCRDEFAKFAATLGVVQNEIYADDGPGDDGETHLRFPMRGRVIDINLACLERIVAAVHRHPGTGQIVLIAGMGNEIGPFTSILLHHEQPALPVDLVAEITAMLPELYLVGSHPDSSLLAMLEQLAETIPEVARYGTAKELERVLAFLVEIFSLRLSHPVLSQLDPTGETVVALNGDASQSLFFDSDSHWTDSVEAVCASRDAAKIDILLTALYRTVCRAFRAGRSKAMNVMQTQICDLYGGIAADERLGLLLERRFDSSLHVAFAPTQSYVSIRTTRANAQAKADRLQKTEPEWVSWAIGLILEAMKVDRAPAAKMFLGTLIKRFNEFEYPPSDIGDASEKLAQLNDWSSLGLIYVAGWCIQLIESDRHKECASLVLEKLLKKSPFRSRLLRAWERNDGAAEGAGMVGSAGLVDREELERDEVLRHEDRTSRWCERGLIALLMRGSAHHDYEDLQIAPKRKPLSQATVQAHAQSLLNSPDVQVLLKAGIVASVDLESVVQNLLNERRTKWVDANPPT